MKTKVWLPVGVLLLIAMIAAVVWAVRSREAPEVVEMREMQNKMMSRDDNVSSEERMEAGKRMRELAENMTDEQRREAFQGMRQQFTKRMREFAELPDEERDAFLDEDIDRMEEMRKRFRDGGGREGRGGREAGQAGGRPGRGGGEGGRGGRPDRQNMSEEDRQARRRARLDNSSAEDRAYMTEYFKAMAARREERGMEPIRGPWGRGGGR